MGLWHCYWCGKRSEKEDVVRNSMCPLCKEDYLYEDLDEGVGYAAFKKGGSKLVAEPPPTPKKKRTRAKRS